jgi:NAD(P)-dependent dehydrogenase (short-subunit alcohol dehydrogenase family)
MERVLITGGSSGIGLATAVRFARRGARVAVIARNPAGLDAVRAQTREAGRECLAFAADVSVRPALARAVAAAADSLGGLDVAVVAAAAASYGRFRDTPPDDFDRVLEVSFRGAVDTVREVLPHLERSDGSLVIVGSVAGTVPLPRLSAYTAAKHALHGFAATLRVELAAQGSGVGVCLVEPGPVDTPFWGNVASEDDLLPPRIPLAYGPEEVAIAIERAAETRAPRTTVGAAWIVVRAAHAVAPSLTERLFSRLIGLVERRGARGSGTRAIWRPSGAGELRWGLRARPSLLVRARVQLDRIRVPGHRPVRQRGRRRDRKEKR